jgi:putative transposase
VTEISTSSPSVATVALPLLDPPSARDRFLHILEQVRQRYDFVIVGYVVMPGHIHLLMSEPEIGHPSLAMQVLKQRTSRAIQHDEKRFWQLRFYNFFCSVQGSSRPPS